MLTIAFIAIGVFGIAALALGLYNRYLTIAAKPIIPAVQKGYVKDYQALQNNLQTTLGISDYQKYSSIGIDSQNGKSNIDIILQSDLSYITKKSLLQTAIDKFSPSLISDKEKLE
jgi:hypothetical protein